MTSPDENFDRAAKLRAQAERYRLLAESLGDLKMVAVAQECASELEAEAAREQMKFWNAPQAA